MSPLARKAGEALLRLFQDRTRVEARRLLRELRRAVGRHPPHKVRRKIQPILDQVAALVAVVAARSPARLANDRVLVALTALAHQSRKEPEEAVRLYARLAEIAPKQRPDALVRIERILGWARLPRPLIETLTTDILRKYPDEPAALQLYAAAHGSGGLQALIRASELPPAAERHAVRLLLESRLGQAEGRADAGAIVALLEFQAANRDRLDDEPETYAVWLHCLVVAHQLVHTLRHRHDSDSRAQLDRLLAARDALAVPSPAALVAATLAGRRSRKNRERIRQAVRSRYVWKRVYETDEALKLSLADRLFEESASWRRRVAGNGDRLSHVLTCLSSTQRFWTDPGFRDGWCARIEDALRDRTVERVGLESRLRFVVGDLPGTDRALEQLRDLLRDADQQHGSGLHTYISPLSEVAAAPSGRLEPGACGFDLAIDRRSGDADPDDPVIVAAADVSYFRRYGVTFARSLQAVEPRLALHFHLMGDVDEVTETVAQVTALGIAFSISTEVPPIRMPYYYATCRFLRAVPLQETLRRPLMITDIDLAFAESPLKAFPGRGHRADAVFRMNDAVRMFERKGSPLLYYSFPRRQPWVAVPATYMFLDDTAGGRRFARMLSDTSGMFLERFSESGKSNWWIDQNITFHAYMRARMGAGRSPEPGITFQNIEEFGLPYGINRPSQPELRRAVGRHPIFDLVPDAPAPHRPERAEA